MSRRSNPWKKRRILTWAALLLIVVGIGGYIWLRGRL